MAVVMAPWAEALVPSAWVQGAVKQHPSTSSCSARQTSAASRIRGLRRGVVNELRGEWNWREEKTRFVAAVRASVNEAIGSGSGVGENGSASEVAEFVHANDLLLPKIILDDWNTLCSQQIKHEGRRLVLIRVLLCSATTLLTLLPEQLLAEDVQKENVSKDQSPLESLLSIFDPDETTKLGKKLPKAYLKSARDVVQTLRDSFSEDAKDAAKFRRNADSAKGAIREYISNWRGVKTVAAEESYQALEKALRVLSEFYSKRGPTAELPENVRVEILNNLTVADDAL